MQIILPSGVSFVPDWDSRRHDMSFISSVLRVDRATGPGLIPSSTSFFRRSTSVRLAISSGILLTGSLRTSSEDEQRWLKVLQSDSSEVLPPSSNDSTSSGEMRVSISEQPWTSLSTTFESKQDESLSFCNRQHRKETLKNTQKHWKTRNKELLIRQLQSLKTTTNRVILSFVDKNIDKSQCLVWRWHYFLPIT